MGALDHLTRKGLSDKKSLEQRPECSEGGGPCRGKVRVRVGSGGQVFQSETGMDFIYLRNN